MHAFAGGGGWASKLTLGSPGTGNVAAIAGGRNLDGAEGLLGRSHASSGLA
jgi:hypothetical protein